MIRIIREDERFATKFEGSTFYFRRLPVAVARKIMADHTSKGVVDMAAVGIDTIRYCLLGWDDVIGGSGDEMIPYSSDLVPFLADDVIQHLSPLIHEGSPSADQLGN